MLTHELLRDEGIMILRPQGPLRAKDFTSLASIVDPYIEKHGRLRGIMVDAESFPGWDSFAALASHLRFVRDHHRLIGQRLGQFVNSHGSCGRARSGNAASLGNLKRTVHIFNSAAPEDCSICRNIYR